MTEHALFLSTPKFISDLLFVSEVLKGIEKEERDAYLIQVLDEINKNLPSNVYIPIYQETTNLYESKRSKRQRRRSNKIGPHRMHRVLKISTSNAFCLHSKERVPFHVIIEVSYDPDTTAQNSDEEEKNADSSCADGGNDHAMPEDRRKGGLQRSVAKLKSLAGGRAGRGESRAIELGSMKHSKATRSSSAKKYSRMDSSIVKRLPKKKFFEKTQGVQKNSNSMYMLDEQDLDRNFLNEGLKISPQSANNLEEAEE